MEELITNLATVSSTVITFVGAGFYFKSQERHDKIRSIGVMALGNISLLLSFILKALTG